MVGQEAVAIGELLAESDPKNADYYRQNAATLEEKAQKLADKYSPIFSKATSKHLSLNTQPSLTLRNASG